MWKPSVTRRRWDDSGGAIVEFIGISVVMLVPVVYMIVALAQIQSATFAAELSASEAARVAVVEGVAAIENGATRREALALASARAHAATAVAAEDFGFELDRNVVVDLSCSSAQCFAPGSDIVAVVGVEVTFPGFPSVVDAWLPALVTVSASGAAAVEDYGRAQ